MPEPPQSRSNGTLLSLAKAAGYLLVWSLFFGVAYTQAALYYSNQNQYFLHGLADAGLGCLNEDWLANTRDPAPLFSLLAALTYRFLHEYFFYVFYLLLLGFYFHCLVGIYDLLSEGKTSRLTRLVFMTLLVALHAGLLRLASARLCGVDYPWYFQAGLAGQYLLGFGLQPSVAGVFLVASLLAYGRGQPWRGTAWACLGGVLHGTYLLAAAMLVLANIALQCKQKRVRDAFLQGLTALALVAPTVIYSFVSFAPTSPAEFAEAQYILAHVRIPHHAEPQRWCDAIALGQVAWMLLGMVLVRRHRLFVFMSIPFVLSFLLTVVQLWTDNDTLALLFPWRTSAILVPAATSIILARLVNRLEPWLGPASAGQGLALTIACGTVLAILVTGGVCITIFEWGYRTNPAELPLLEFVKTQDCRGAVYLLPVEIPKIGAGPKGAASTNFTPAPRAGKGGHLIAIDLQRFRLSSGTPIFVDFKSIPYKDVEVLEWHRRLLWTQKRYALRDWNEPEILRQLTEHGITHVVTSSDRDLRSSTLGLVYEDANYRIYHVPGSFRKKRE